MSIKRPAEIEKLAEAGVILQKILSDVCGRVKVGMTGRELDRYAEERIRAVGATPAFKGYGEPPFPATLCVSVNSCVVHGIPDDRPFSQGDIVSIDIGMVYQGLYTDMARSVGVGKMRAEDMRLMKVARQALDKALALVRPGITTGDIGAVVQSYVEGHGFGVVRDLAGHGVGYDLHEAPEVPNFGRKGEGEPLVAGMVLAIEPMITAGSWKVKVGKDRWSILTQDGSNAAHSEDMVAVTDDGHRILTRG